MRRSRSKTKARAAAATFAATLEVGTPLSFTPGRGTFVLPVPIAGTATAVITVPGDQTEVHLSRGIVLRRSSATGQTTIEATLDPGTPTEVWWSTRDATPPQPNARNVQVLSDVKTLVTIGEADVRLLALVDVTIVQGEPSQMDLALPPGYELISASGASLERTDKVDASIRELRQLLKERPGDAVIQNALGYTLADRTREYDEAHELIAAALTQTPDSAAVLDSMAWVLYRQERPREALPYLRRARELASDPEIDLHLGEALWAVGDQAEARKTWQSALERSPDDEKLRERLERTKP